MASRCPLCGKAKEDLHHLLIHYPSVWGMWESLISIPSLNWVCPLMAKDLIPSWSCFPIEKRARKLSREIPLCLFWGNLEGKEPDNFRRCTFFFIKTKDFFCKHFSLLGRLY